MSIDMDNGAMESVGHGLEELGTGIMWAGIAIGLGLVFTGCPSGRDAEWERVKLEARQQGYERDTRGRWVEIGDKP